MPKKNLIEEALIEAQELERASMENAKDIVLESFAPDFVSFFSDILNESDEKDEDDMEDEELDEGNEHDMGKEPDNGRQGYDPAVDDEDETKKQSEKNSGAPSGTNEGKYDDVSGDPTPEKGQAGLPKKGQPATKKASDNKMGNMHPDGDAGWEAEHSGGDKYADTNGSADPEKAPGDMPGKKPSTKKTDDGWEEEHQGGQKHADTANAVPGREGLAGTPKPPVKKVDEAEGEDKEELDVPDDLFDDDKDITKEAEEPEIKDGFDGDDDDVNIKIEKDDTNEGVEIEIEDDDDEDEKSDDKDAKEEVDENLYVKENGEFKKITPAEYLQTRIDTLEASLDESQDAVLELRGQLQETHLFNAKLAHLNKLYMTGAFTNTEKERIAERLDECDSLDEVKSLYSTIISEVKDTNPLDDFSNLIKENRVKRQTKTEKIYESADVARMKRIMNYETE